MDRGGARPPTRLGLGRLALVALVVASIVATERGSLAEGDIERRIAEFWERVDRMQPSDHLAATDLGQWALNIIERDARARISVGDFRSSTAAMQAALERAGPAPVLSRPPAAGVEQRIAEFWQRIDAKRPGELLAAADLGQWALNVIDRDAAARITVGDFRASTAAMQAGLERASAGPPSARGSLASAITDASAKLGWPDQRSNPPVQRTVPLADRVTLRSTAPDRWEVLGAAGSIPDNMWQRGRRHVRVMATEWRSEACVESRADGSFGPASVDAGPGVTILVVPVEESNCSRFATNSGGALVLRTPEGVEPGPAMAFAASGAFEGTRWIGRGELLGDRARISFSLTQAFSRCLAAVLHIHRLFDATGTYVTGVNSTVHGPVLTPTGLGIETSQGSEGYWARFGTPTGPCLADGLEMPLAGWASALEPGWYRARVALYDATTGTLAREQERLDPSAEIFSASAEVGYLPMIPVGAAQRPSLPVTLLNEDPSWGSAGIRGIEAKEDATSFALASRRAAQGPFIASPNDPLTGTPRSFLLEPFLPTLTHTGFGNTYQRTPLLAFDAVRPGALSLTLRGPDGADRVLASEAPVLRSFISGGANSASTTLTFAGPNRMYGLLTDTPGLEVAFRAYGLHTVRLSGALRTVWGQEIALRGTYEIWVAEPLQLSIGTLQGTPLEVGQQYSPVVTVRPGVPADVTVQVDHYVNGDVSGKRTYRVTGKANAFGYFVAGQRWAPSAHGEYIARVEARYSDPVDNVLWMATRTGASIVATPDTTLIAHGERNERLAGIRGDGVQRTWFFNRALDPACGEATCESVGRTEARGVGNYPFHRGDVAWIADVAPITPTVTLEDPAGVLGAAGFAFPRGADQNSASLQHGGNRPHDIDRWLYWYSSAVRPDDVSIFHAASDGSRADHQQWYGNDSYNCQIGLTCQYIWDDFPRREDRHGDEEGDIKVFFGGVAVKAGQFRQFVPYASMGVIIPEAVQEGSQRFRFRDDKGQRICPPYQGAAGGLATCGPLLTVRGRAFDLFVTPTGTRPGSLLSVGDRFVFSGLVWPTLDVAYEVIVREPSGRERTFAGRASRVGYIDGRGAEFDITETGVHRVRVKLTQDRPLPSTGLAPSPPIIADGATVQREHGYGTALSAILGTVDSSYSFFVGEPGAAAAVRTDVTTRPTGVGRPFPVPSAIVLAVEHGAADEVHYTLSTPGFVIRTGSWTPSDSKEIRLSETELYAEGYTNVILGADSLDLMVLSRVGAKWLAKSFNLRGLTPFGGEPVTFR